VWYQYLNQLSWTADLIGSSRETCRTYFKHFLVHWSGDDPSVFAADLEICVDNFMKPGNIQGGFNWHVSSAATRLLSIEEKLPPMPRIAVPSRFLWGKRDPIVKPEWSDRLDEYFASYTVDFVDAGHYVHYQRPDIPVPEILAFFEACK
jgi:pimeloyl-ACP methyl ester carboxylesterase